jgi:hypothetical protein
MADRYDESCFSWNDGMKHFRQRHITVYVPHDQKGKPMGIIEPLYFARIEDAQLLAEAEAMRLIHLVGSPRSTRISIPGMDRLYSDYMDRDAERKGFKVEFSTKDIRRGVHDDGALLMLVHWKVQITQTIEKTVEKTFDGHKWSRQVQQYKIIKDWHEFPEDDIWRFPVEAEEIRIIEHYLEDESDGATRADLVKARKEEA